MQIYLFYSLLFGFTYFNRKCDSITTDLSGHVCRQSGSELICNVIPSDSDIPDGVKSVHLINLYVPGKIIRKGTFSSDKWGKIKELEISADRRWTENHDTVQTFDSLCFDGLKSLEKLHISISTSVEFTPETLRGLPNLKLLDLAGCRRFFIDNLITALNDAYAVPNLQSLNISLLNSFRNGNRLTDNFFKLISNKKLKELDISSMQILLMNITSFEENCATLEYVNISKIMLSDYTRDNVARYCPNLKYMDASYITLPTTAFPDRGPTTKIFYNRSIPVDFNWTPLRLLSNIEQINLSGLTPKQTRILIKNVSVHIFEISRFSLRRLVLRDNNLERLDIKVFSRNSKLESIDLSSCNIRYLRPELLSSFTLLAQIDISNNHLNNMMIEDAGMFSNLFRNLAQLSYVNLAGNHLTYLPRDIFKYNSQMEIIDLSNNLLTQVSFDVERLKKVKTVNLAGNIIKILNDASMARLSNLLNTNNRTNNSTMERLLILNGNPISCSSCDSLSSIKWLVHSESVVKGFSALECLDENAGKVGIDENVIDNVQIICNRPKVIIMSCVAVAITIAIVIILVLVMRYRRRRRQYKLEMEDRVALIRQGAESHQFVVFLSYSSKDDDFVYKYVYDPLNEHLRNMVGENRDLVCEGDRDFQLGRPIHDQISLLLKKSSVVVVLLTDNYSLSVHCRNEFDQAFMLEKPIILMIKDHVDTALMTPLIQDLYEKRTRILWMWENGQYILKTSWENLCTSIVELVDRT
ncbi:toll-like receptor 7 [Mercenaria mercenaria]|uniref:toll-like receptor 7 n=1 Tax=Mercenaria mercenaria TaxID=6596 RepID=UPI00234EC93F|nr:toll-like receptor 7 [Mercenaria mercenaria]